jgi:hypothetical protein
LAAALATLEWARANDLLVADEAKFGDFKCSAFWLVKEHIFIDR